jgi:membrane protease YdiL (CAAX protease family)
LAHPLTPDGEQPPVVFGPWRTAAWGFLILVAFELVQALALLGFVALRRSSDPDLDVGRYVDSLLHDGLLLSVATLSSSVVCTSLVYAVVRRRLGPSTRDFLGLRRAGVGAVGSWLGATVLFMVASDAITWSIGRPLVPEFMSEAYATATIPLLFWLALLVAAPAVEEMLFRGFLLEGLRSGLGTTPALLLTSAVWASIHAQYGVYEQATVFALGILFGLARLRSGSLLPCVLMHALLNLGATLEAAWLVAGR